MYTDEAVMNELMGIENRNGSLLENKINQMGGSAKSLRGVIIAEGKTGDGYGSHNGNVIGVDLHKIISMIESGSMPIVSPLGFSPCLNKFYNINAATVGAYLAKELDTLKCILVNSKGGVLRNSELPNGNGNIIQEIVLDRDYDRLVEERIIYGGMKKNVDEAMYCLNPSFRPNGDDRNVQIVGPYNLLKELFTKKGAGTLIRNGYRINDPKHIGSVNQNAIRQIIESGFRQRISPAFFDENKIVFMEENLKGVAVVIPNADGLGPYLDVITVDELYRINGMGDDFIYKIMKWQSSSSPTLFLRSKIERNANSWYNEISDGRVKFVAKSDGQVYNLYWIGLGIDKIEKALNYVENRYMNFEPRK